MGRTFRGADKRTKLKNKNFRKNRNKKFAAFYQEDREDRKDRYNRKDDNRKTYMD